MSSKNNNVKLKKIIKTSMLHLYLLVFSFVNVGLLLWDFLSGPTYLGYKILGKRGSKVKQDNKKMKTTKTQHEVHNVTQQNKPLKPIKFMMQYKAVFKCYHMSNYN